MVGIATGSPVIYETQCSKDNASWPNPSSIYVDIQVEQVDLSNTSAVLFPSGIDPNRRSNFGNAQSILPKQFLVERGAEG